MFFAYLDQTTCLKTYPEFYYLSSFNRLMVEIADGEVELEMSVDSGGLWVGDDFPVLVSAIRFILHL